MGRFNNLGFINSNPSTEGGVSWHLLKFPRRRPDTHEVWLPKITGESQAFVYSRRVRQDLDGYLALPDDERIWMPSKLLECEDLLNCLYWLEPSDKVKVTRNGQLKMHTGVCNF